MTTLAIKEQRINIYMDITYVNQIKELVKNKQIPSITKFCQEAVQEKLIALEKQQKDQLMLQAMHDPEFVARCEEIQNDFAAIDAEGQVNDEW